MTPQKTDFSLRLGFGLVALLFVISLPTWALGIILAVGLVGKVAVRHLRERQGPEAESPTKPDRGERHG
jgi:hypothetical protein